MTKVKVSWNTDPFGNVQFEPEEEFEAEVIPKEGPYGPFYEVTVRAKVKSLPEPTTLGEVFKESVPNPYGDDFAEGDTFDAGVDATKALFEKVVYGTDEPCPKCGGNGILGRQAYIGLGNCLDCGGTEHHYGTGRIKTPGMVERVEAALPAVGAAINAAAADYEWRESLRREIGKVTT
jgi:hypothetical protein